MFTRFMDMHSHGYAKEPQEYILIEACEADAKIIFYNRFDHNPNCVTCTCCGEDYSIQEYDTLREATAYDRGCNSVEIDKTLREWVYVEEANPEQESWRPYVTLEDYLLRPSVLVIYDKDIKADDRIGEVPSEGWVWQ